MKNMYCLERVMFKLSFKGKKTKIWKVKLKITYSLPLEMAFLTPENKSQQLEDMPQADFGCVPERFLLSVRTKSITENCVYWKLHPLICFCIVSTDFLVWSLSTDAPFDFIQVLLILSFSFIMSTLLSVKGCCYLLVEMKFLLLC